MDVNTIMNKELIIITESANNRFKEMLAASGEEAFRFGVKGGGCSGFQFFLEFDKLENVERLDEVVDTGDVKVIVDAMSITYILGTTIDWVDDMMGSHFTFNAPNQASSCGCKQSVNFF